MRTSADHRRHQRRALALVRAVVGPRLETELAIPESSRAIDCLFPPQRASEAWGVIQGDLDGRAVLVEHFSQPPTPVKMATVVLKAAWLVEQWLKGRWRTARPPLALVLMVGRPEQALDLFAFEERGLQGCHRARQGPLEVLAVDVRALPPGAGTSFLRAFDHRVEAADNLRSLYADAGLPAATRMRIGEAVMKEPSVWGPTAVKLTAQELVELGRKEGREEGREEGSLRGRRAVLELQLSRRLGALSPRLRTALAGCADVSRLERAAALVLEPLDAATLERRVCAVLSDGERPRGRGAGKRR